MNVQVRSQSLLTRVTTFSAQIPLYQWATLAFFLVGLLGLTRHELWRDEAQAWLIARDSVSIPDLFRHLRYEGHPSAWYLLLYALTRVTHNLVAMQLLHLVIATATAAVFVRSAPFSAAQRLMFVFGYFPLYEYALISRNYALGVLLLVLFCALFRHRKAHYLPIFAVLALLANTSVYGLILAGVLGAVLALEFLVDQITARSSRAEMLRFALGLLVLAGSGVLALIQIIPPSDGFRGGWERAAMTRYLISPAVDRFAVVVSQIWASYMPIPDLSTYHFWNTNLLTDSVVGASLMALFSIALLILCVALFWKYRYVLLIYGCGTAGLLGFSFGWYSGKLRHYGHLFILLIVCCWLASLYAEQQHAKSRLRSYFLTVVLVVNLIAGLYAYALDLVFPFSSAQATASYITTHQLEAMPMVGSPDINMAPLAALLDRTIYYPEIRAQSGFTDWSSRRRTVSPSEILDQARAVARAQRSPIVLILSRPLAPDLLDANLTPLATFDQAMLDTESFYLYLLHPLPGG